MNPPYRYGRGEAVSDQTAAGGRPPAGPAVPAMECVAPDRMFVIGRVPEAAPHGRRYRPTDAGNGAGTGIASLYESGVPVLVLLTK